MYVCMSYCLVFENKLIKIVVIIEIVPRCLTWLLILMGFEASVNI